MFMACCMFPAITRDGHQPQRLNWVLLVMMETLMVTSTSLQAAPLKAWGGKSENVAAGQRAFTHRARMNGAATLGKWTEQQEKAA